MEHVSTDIDPHWLLCIRNKVRQKDQRQYVDFIRAYKRFYENKPRLDEHAAQRIRQAYVMCKYMEPDVDDVITMLLYYDYLYTENFRRKLKISLGEDKCKKYYDLIENVCKNAPDKSDWSRDDCISYEIMMRVCNKMFKAINKGRMSMANTAHAYNIAKEAHQWKRRKNGEPHIAHSIRVASSLAEIGVETPVIAAAMLHDVVDESNITIRTINERYTNNRKVAQYVEAVLTVDKEYAESMKPSEYGCDKTELDEKSLDNLVRLVDGKEDMVFALYIKAADIVDNLRTYEPSASLGDGSGDTLQEDEEIQLAYIPLLEAFHLGHFIREIEDLRWRAADIERYSSMKLQYDNILAFNRRHINAFKQLLLENTQSDINIYLQAYGECSVDVYNRDLLPYELYNCLKHQDCAVEDLFKKTDKRFIPLCDLDIVVQPTNMSSYNEQCAYLDAFMTGFIRMFESKIAVTGRTIVALHSKSHDAYSIEVEDAHRNLFRCRIILKTDYEEQIRGVHVSNVTSAMEGNTEIVKIKLRNGDERVMPKGSTIIDLAFAIHEQIGFTARSAIVNKKQRSIYYVLQEGDQVEVIADSTPPNIIRHVRISWLKYVVTKKAKNKIIEFLSDWYEGDDPKNESKAQTEVVDRVAERILENMRSRDIG